MTWLSWGLIALIVLAVTRVGPLRGARRIGAACLRLAALWGVWLALSGAAIGHRQAQPRHVVYLVDQSASIEPEQTAWMARRIASLESIRPRQIRRAVLAFGKEPRMVAPEEQAPLTDAAALAQTLAATTVPREATDLEAALLGSLSIMPPQTRSRVILLTDARQTSGNIERVLVHLHRFGVEVFPVAVSSARPTSLLWERLTVPPVAQQGSSIPITLVFSNGTGRTQPVEITVKLSGLPAPRQRSVAGQAGVPTAPTGVPLARRRGAVRPGWQVVSVSVPALASGTMALEVSVASSTGLPAPRQRSVAGQAGQPLQQRRAFVEIEGPPQVLFVLERPSQLPLLASALKRRQMQIAVATPAELPTDAQQLLDHDAVILFQVPKSSLTQSQAEALAQYVERFGGGLLMVGLGGKLDEELAAEVPLDALLPVRFEPKGLQEAQRRVCIVLLIDRSASMMGPRIAATKRAAVELVKQLQPEDLVGVLAFDTIPYVIVEVQPSRYVTDKLIDKLVRLKSTGGTDVLPALRAAQERLALTDSTVRHIILLSDGNTPFDSKAYRQLIEELTRDHVTLSTIGIGSAFVNADFLEWLATRTGGTFYQMRTLEELPSLIARDTQQALGRLPFTEGYFRPIAREASAWSADPAEGGAGIPEWPAVKGYLTTSAKPGAQVELEIRLPAPRQRSVAGQAGQAESHDPLLARWPKGAGQVVVFTSDADRRWTPDWIRWPEFDRVWAQVARSAMRPRPPEALFAWLDPEETSPQVVIEGEMMSPTAQLIASDTGAAVPLALVQESQFRWRAHVGHVDSGWHRLVITASVPTPDPLSTSSVADADAPSGRESAGAIIAKRWIQIGHASGGPEQPSLPPDDALLRRIAQATEGISGAPDAAFLPPTEVAEVSRPLRGWLLPLVALLLLADVAVRGRTML